MRPLTVMDTARADKLMAAGKAQEAKDLLMQGLAQTNDKGAYADAAAIFLSGGMYDDAKQVFAMYEERTGKSLRSSGGSDFSLEDIDAEAAKNRPLDPNEEHFRRKSRMKRIKEIIVTPDDLVLRRADGHHTYAWSSVAGKIVTSRARFGEASRVTLTTPDGSVKFWVYPNMHKRWENEGKLLPALRAHIQFAESKRGRLGQVLQVVLVAVAVAALFYFGHHH